MYKRPTSVSSDEPHVDAIAAARVIWFSEPVTTTTSSVGGLESSRPAAVMSLGFIQVHWPHCSHKRGSAAHSGSVADAPPSARTRNRRPSTRRIVGTAAPPEKRYRHKKAFSGSKVQLYAGA